MSQIDGNKIGEFELNGTLNNINNIIKRLSSFGGGVFGEYVREVVVPRMKNPTCNVIFNSVDIWFKNQMSADDFVKHIVKHTTWMHVETYSSENIDMRESIQYKYFTNGCIPIKFNIIVSSSFPIYDFDVNSLTYFYVNGNEKIESNFPTLENKLEQIIKSINMKEANMMKNYFTNMVNHYLTYPNRVKMINEIYEARGWTIMCEGVKITSPFIGTTDDAIAKEKFVNKTLLERSKEQYIPNGIQWSPEKVSKAKDKNQFISVGGVRISNRFLSGATRSWTSDDLDEQKRIFNLEYRITGTPSNVFMALKEYGYSDFQIQEVIENSITKDNYESSKKTEYLEELERHKKSSENILDKKENPENLDERKKRLITNFTSSDEIFRTAIINRNKAFFECISDFGITDKFYISNRIIEYPKELSSKIIIQELTTKK